MSACVLVLFGGFNTIPEARNIVKKKACLPHSSENLRE